MSFKKNVWIAATGQILFSSCPCLACAFFIISTVPPPASTHWDDCAASTDVYEEGISQSAAFNAAFYCQVDDGRTGGQVSQRRIDA
jgi:hypothetical protein